MEHQITLSDAIENIRQEISKAIEKGEGQSVKFALNEIDLELGVEVETTGNLGGKIGIVVARIDGETTSSDKNIHRVRIKLTPIDSDGKPFTVSGARPRPQ